LSNISLSNTGSSYLSDTITITSGAGIATSSYFSGSTVTIGPIDTSTFSFNYPEEWKDCFPDWDRIQKMCETYPGLRIAFEKFKTTYKLVQDDYDTPPDKRTKP
jgi:hypothetical protein